VKSVLTYSVDKCVSAKINNPQQLKLQVTSVRCGASVDTYPSGFNIFLVLNQYIGNDLFNIDSTLEINLLVLQV